MRNLITAQEVIDLAFAENSNMMAESISDTAIRIAEIKYIRPAFGVMYPLLADKYADFTNDYVKPALAYFVKCEIVSSIAIDMSNSGVAVANPQYQSAATDKQRQRLYDSEMSKAKTLLDFALSYIAENKESFPDFSGDAPKKHHRLGGILLGSAGVSRGQSASITGDAFKAEFDKYIKEMGETAEEVEQLIESTGVITEEAKDATNNAILATESANKATENANKAGAEAVRIATESAQEATTAKENAEQATEQANVATAIANEAAQRANEEVEKLKEKADIDGNYPSMTVGKADKVNMEVKTNGNIVLTNLAGQSKEFMPATPSGDPMHYAYEAEGAEYDTTKGRWVLYGVEMTNEEMRSVYNETIQFAKLMPSADSRLPFFASELFRAMNFRVNLAGGSPSLMYACIPSWRSMFRNNLKLVTINTVCGSDGQYLLRVTDLNTAFGGCSYFKNILYPIDISRIEADDRMTNAFSGCYALEDIKLKGLKVNISFAPSSKIKKEMLLYIIENSAATREITITLHADAYSRLATDADIVAALTSKTLVKLASA